MSKKIKIIITGVIIYWLVMFLFDRYFLLSLISLRNESRSYFIIVMFLISEGAPLLSGLIMSALLRDKYDWIYGVIMFHVYMIIISLQTIIVKIFIYKDSFDRIPGIIITNYHYQGIPGTIFAFIGGLIGHYINKKLNTKVKSFPDSQSSLIE